MNKLGGIVTPFPRWMCVCDASWSLLPRAATVWLKIEDAGVGAEGGIVRRVTTAAPRPPSNRSVSGYRRPRRCPK